MEKLTGFLQELATKLGTTTEYLWEILIKQAKISSITNLIMIVIVSLAGFVLYKMHKSFMIEHGDYRENFYEKYPVSPIIMGIISFFWIITTICVYFEIPNIIYGFVNPEYWALNEILNSIKN